MIAFRRMVMALALVVLALFWFHRYMQATGESISPVECPHGECKGGSGQVGTRTHAQP